MAVSVQSLVLAGIVAEVRGGAVAGDCSFAYAGHGWRVVRHINQGSVADVVVVGHDGDLC